MVECPGDLVGVICYYQTGPDWYRIYYQSWTALASMYPVQPPNNGHKYWPKAARRWHGHGSTWATARPLPWFTGWGQFTSLKWHWSKGAVVQIFSAVWISNGHDMTNVIQFTVLHLNSLNDRSSTGHRRLRRKIIEITVINEKESKLMHMLKINWKLKQIFIKWKVVQCSASDSASFSLTLCAL